MTTYNFPNGRARGVRRFRKSVLAICGGGNAGHALAVIASQKFDGDIVWLAGSAAKAEILREGVFSQDGLRSTGVITGCADKVRLISANPAEVIPQADVVLIAVPAFAHANVLRQINPYLKNDVIIGSLPARSGFEFEVTRLISEVEPNGRRKVFGLQTLPWSTRVAQPGKIVNFGAHKAKVLMATLPGAISPDAAAMLSVILSTEVVPTHNFLNMTLGNPGQVVHPGLMYGFFSAWSGEKYCEDAIPRFYADATDQIGAFVERLSAEIVAVAREVERASAHDLDLSGVLSIHEWLRISYPTQTGNATSVATCFRTGPLQARKAPMLELTPGSFVPNFQYRYLSEDVPFGLAVSKAIAEMVQEETPAIDAVICWAQEKLGKRYIRNGKLDGPDARTLPTPQNHAIATLSDLVGWYASGQRVTGSLERAAL